MITLQKKNSILSFQIGPHERPVEAVVARELGELLRQDMVEQIAGFTRDWQSGPWKLEGARDDIDPANTKSESRRRLLLTHGSKKWHILRSEAVTLGGLFRSLAS